MDAACASLRGGWRQLRVLVVLRARLARRQLRGVGATAAGAPLLVCLLLLALQGVADWVLALSVPRPNTNPVGPLPRCDAAVVPGCVTVAYAPPGVPWVEELLREVARRNGLDFGADFQAVGDAYEPPVDPSPAGILANKVCVCEDASCARWREGQSAALHCLRTQDPLCRPCRWLRDAGAIAAELLARPNRTQNVLLFTTAYLPWQYDTHFTANTSVGYVVYINGTADRWPVERNNYGLETMRAVDEAAVALAGGGADTELEVSWRPFPTPPNRFQGYDVPGGFGGIYFYLPTMVVFLNVLTEVVLEKERRIRLSMHMMGLRTAPLWLSWMAYGTSLAAVSSLALVAGGAACGFSLFTRSNPVCAWLVLFSFGFAMVGIAALLSTLLSSSKASQTTGYAVILLGFVFQAILSSGYGMLVDLMVDLDGSPIVRLMNSIFSFWPPYLFAKAFYDISTLTAHRVDYNTGTIETGPGYKWDDMFTETDHVVFGIGMRVPSTWDTLMLLFRNAVVYWVVALYLDAVVEGDQGAAQHPLFFVDPRFWGFGRGRKVGRSGAGRAASPRVAGGADGDVTYGVEAEASVAAEHDRPLCISRLHKVYGGGVFSRLRTTVRAVNGLSLTADVGQVLCLLGPNGSGKSTTVGVLCGLLPPTSGEVSLFGHDVQSELTACQAISGICPQHDALWDELTAADHLRVFAGIKGLPERDTESELETRLGEVDLWRARDQRAGTFSGGMKRRLSLAIATIGSPRFLFLDEPSAGLDPVNRRRMWTAVQKLKEDRVIVLTTHDMQEADSLADRVAVMAAGTLRAIGTPFTLKSQIGGGYHLSVVVEPDDVARLVQSVVAIAPGARLEHADGGTCVIAVPESERVNMPSILRFLEGENGSFVREWGISHTTLEDVFLRVAGGDAAASGASAHAPPADGPAQSAAAIPEGRGSSPDEDADDGDEAEGEDAPLIADDDGGVMDDPECTEDDDDNDDETVEGQGERAGDAAVGTVGPSKDSSACEVRVEVSGTSPPRRMPRSRPYAALLHKNATLQTRQMGTNLCQIVTVVLVMILLVSMELVLEQTLVANAPVEISPSQPIPLNGNILLGQSAVSLHCREFFLISADEGVDPTEVGVLSSDVGVNSSGLLGNIPQIDCYAMPNASSTSLIPDLQHIKVPYFEPRDDENAMMSELYDGIEWLNLQPIAELDYEASDRVPDGTLAIHDLSLEAASPRLRYTFSTNDNPFVLYHRANNFTRADITLSEVMQAVIGPDFTGKVLLIHEGRMMMQDLINSAFREEVIGEQRLPPEAAQYAEFLPDNFFRLLSLKFVQRMPFKIEIRVDQIVEAFGTVLYPLVLSLQLPVYLYILVTEKETRMRELQKAHGLKALHYFVANTIFFLALYGLAVVFFWAAGISAGFRVFTMNAPSVLSAVFVGWGLALVGLAVLTSAFISSRPTASIAGYTVSLFGTLVGLVPAAGIWAPLPGNPLGFTRMPSWLLLSPQSALCRAIVLLTHRCSMQMNCYTDWSFVGDNDELATVLFFMYLDAFLLLVLGIYLDRVLPSQYGIQQHPLFFLPVHVQEQFDVALARLNGWWSASWRARMAGFTQIDGDDDHGEIELQETAVPSSLAPAEDIVDCKQGVGGEEADEEVDSEETRVRSASGRDLPLLVQGLTKVYAGSNRVALSPMWLGVEEGCFGLLGPNGAGKTTLLNCLTGVFPATSGDAAVAGFSVADEIERVHGHIGVCPQHNVLWDELSSLETLLFFARLKGVPASHERRAVWRALIGVGLHKVAQRPSRGLSGGMKRRLCLAIALVGDSAVAFLDEPSAGLDPHNRRRMWQLLLRARKGRAIVLTTHAMDEAELLATRVGVLAKGKLRCLGTQQRLREVYGGGYLLTVSLDLALGEEARALADARVAEHVPAAVPEHGRYAGVAVYRVPREAVRVSELFGAMEVAKGRQGAGFVDWGVAQESLDAVFRRIVSKYEDGEW